ncbi:MULTISPECIES: hypothetical protein [Vagococcus]|uniref:hypothetical protein n=1 Tax=Vagococcus TaxID=2737 RepID=UPI000E50F0AF|nr:MULTISPECIES: hypothetical protein [Vagococcus]RHH67506.1 hypothetical protein DW196_09310 [Vagococcus sp. AM17-17]
MYPTEIYVHRINHHTQEIEVETFDLLGVRKRIKVSPSVLAEAERALETSHNYPVIMLFDQETNTFIHDVPTNE